MLLDFKMLLEKYNVTITGILHVGAHECEEIEEYEKLIPREKIVWVEAMPKKIAECKEKHPGIQIEEAVVSDVVENVIFKIANNGHSSSMLDLFLHKKYHPRIHYVDYFKATTKLLSTIIEKYTPTINFNFINLDIQGAELKALKGMKNYLPNVNYIYMEVNSDYLYKRCALVDEVDAFLGQYGLKRVETAWNGNCNWGDAFYVRM